MYKVSAVVVDNDWQGLGLPSGCSTEPLVIEFTHHGVCWYEMLDQLVFEYSARYRGGKRLDADCLELRSCCMIRMD